MAEIRPPRSPMFLSSARKLSREESFEIDRNSLGKNLDRDWGP